MWTSASLGLTNSKQARTGSVFPRVGRRAGGAGRQSPRDMLASRRRDCRPTWAPAGSWWTSRHRDAAGLSIVFAANDSRPDWPDHCGATPQAERLRVPSSQRRRSARGMSDVLSHTRRSTRRRVHWRASASILGKTCPFGKVWWILTAKTVFPPAQKPSPMHPKVLR